jgi:hypothetical protein
MQDNATPSGNALAARALLELSLYTGNEHWRLVAEQMLGKIQVFASHHPTAFAYWLTALDIAIVPMTEIAILGDLRHPATQSLVAAIWSRYRTDALAAISNYPPLPEAPPLLQGRQLVDGQPTAYVCQNFVCLHPVPTADELLAQLEQPLWAV